MATEINMNTIVKVQLREHGKAIIKKIDPTNEEYVIMKEDKLELPLWELMEIFGPYQQMGPQDLFVENKIQII